MSVWVGNGGAAVTHMITGRGSPNAGAQGNAEQSPGARVLGFAFSDAECHEELRAVGLPGSAVLKDNRDEFAG